MSQDDEQKNSMQQSQERIQEKKNSIARNVGEKFIKSAGKKGGKNVLSQKTMGMLLKFAPVLGYVLIGIMIFIIIGGLISFFLTMPGLISAKLKQFGDSITKSFKGLFMQNAVAQVSKNDVIDFANYLKEMDYDLIGYGFVKPKRENSNYIYEELINQGYTRVTETKKENDGTSKNLVFFEDKDGNRWEDNFLDQDGTLYNGKTGEKIDSGKAAYKKWGIEYDEDDKITSLDDVDSSIIKTYLISDRSVYILRNDDNTFLKKLFSSFVTMFTSKDYNSWANGLVRLYDAENSIATKEYLKGLFDGHWWEAIEYDDNGKLKIKKGFNNGMKYETDGWSGRYGLSKDFLISLHLATLCPDFVQTVVQSFDTEVQVYLDEIEGADAEVRLFDTASSVIGTEATALKIADFTDRFADIGIDIDDKLLDMDSWWVSKKEAARFYFMTKMSSPSTCTFSYEGGLPDRVFPWDTEAGDLASRSVTFEHNDFSSEISQSVKNFVEELANSKNNFGFDIEKFEEEVKLVDDDKCSTKKLINNLNVKEDMGKNPSTQRKIILPKKDVYDRLNNDFFSNNGYLNLDEFILKDYSCSVYPRRSETLEEYNNIIYIHDKAINNENEDKFDITDIEIGETCAFEFGKFICNSESKIIEYELEESKKLNCNCKFCKSFWKKYLWMYYPWPHEYSNIAIEDGKSEVADNNIDSTDSFTEMVVDLYSWEYDYKGEKLKFSISFYASTANSQVVKLVLNRCWTEEETKAAMDAIEEQDTCSKRIQECSDIKEAEKIKVCSKCKRYVKHVVWSLEKINDPDFKTAVPYIARVIGSWFRDTYFIIPNSNSGDQAIKDAITEHGYKESDLTGENVKIIQNDNEFLEATGELWTEYIMDPNGDYAKFVLDTTGELIQENGLEEYINKLKSTVSAHDVLSEKDEKALRNLIQEEYTYIYKFREVTAYARWKGDDDDEEANKLLEKYNISLVKIPITKTINGVVNSEDENKELAWSAYSRARTNSTVWQDVDVDDDSPYYMRNVDRYYGGAIRIDSQTVEAGTLQFQVGLTGVFNMEQEQDAQRGMTNSKIKYLFKNKKYYKYDGTIARAFQIDEDWKKCVDLMPLSNLDPKKFATTIATASLKNMFRPKLFSFWKSVEQVEDDINMGIKELKESTLNSFIDLIYYQDNKKISDLEARFIRWR